MTWTAPHDKSLQMSFELSNSKWVLTSGIGGKSHRRTTIDPGDAEALQGELMRAKKKFGLAANAPVVTCYEAGRDGFWVHRWLEQQRVQNLVVDSSSIQVSRRARNKKTDKIDGRKLLKQLGDHLRGEPDVWSVVRVPPLEIEDLRRREREMTRLQQERTAHRNRLKGLLAAQGIKLDIKPALEQLDQVKTPYGESLGERLKGELRREYKRLALVESQLAELRANQKADAKRPLTKKTPTHIAKARALMRLRGVDTTAWLLSTELFAWREFTSARQVGGLAGLTGTPHQSGNTSRELGISKAGSARIRCAMVELAWAWLRHQPKSNLSLWFEKRFSGERRMKRKGIVALARKLLVAFWRYLDSGVVPEGAELKAG